LGNAKSVNLPPKPPAGREKDFPGGAGVGGKGKFVPDLTGRGTILGGKPIAQDSIVFCGRGFGKGYTPREIQGPDPPIC